MGDFLSANWGDLASVVGLGVSLIGFAATIHTTRRTRRATTQIQRQLAVHDWAQRCATATAMIGEIKRLNREEAWKVLPDRYAALRSVLIEIRSEIEVESNKEKVDEFTSYLSDCETIIERSHRTKASPKPHKLNEKLASYGDMIVTLSSAARVKIRNDAP